MNNNRITCLVLFNFLEWFLWCSSFNWECWFNISHLFHDYISSFCNGILRVSLFLSLLLFSVNLVTHSHHISCTSSCKHRHALHRPNRTCFEEVSSYSTGTKTPHVICTSCWATVMRWFFLKETENIKRKSSRFPKFISNKHPALQLMKALKPLFWISAHRAKTSFTDSNASFFGIGWVSHSW